MQERTDTPGAALWDAARTGDLATVEHLIAEGVDVNVWDSEGRNALTWAAATGDLEMIEVLLEAGAWIDPFEDDGYRNPLMCAAENGHKEIVSFLLQHGADPTLHGTVGHVTEECMARNEFPAIAALLRQAEDDWRRAHRD